jgi:dUTP pyrophosphatase
MGNAMHIIPNEYPVLNFSANVTAFSPPPGPLKVKLLTENAKAPEKATEGSVGYDIFTATEGVVDERGKFIFKTDIAIDVPEGYYAKISQRSSVTWNYDCTIEAGIIDPDYRGNIEVVVFNHSNESKYFPKHFRIAQLILTKYVSTDIEIVDSLMPTKRGTKGFGKATADLASEPDI